jgi:hypothetical protein
VRSSLCNFFSYYETQQLILGTGTAIWWLTEPHWISLKTLADTNALAYFALSSMIKNLNKIITMTQNQYFVFLVQKIC